MPMLGFAVEEANAMAWRVNRLSVGERFNKCGIQMASQGGGSLRNKTKGLLRRKL